MATVEMHSIPDSGGPGLAEAVGPGPWRRCARAASTLLTVVVAMAAALLVVTAAASHLSAPGQYTAFGHPVMSVLSGSMSPVIHTGDLIVDQPVTRAGARQLHPGQIISFRAARGSSVIITHRIVGRKIDYGSVEYVTKGDANESPDAVLVPSGDVVGVFQHAIRGGGYVLTALHRPAVPILLIASVVLFFLAGPLFRLARRLDERAGEENPAY